MMMNRGASRVVRSAVVHAGPRLFSTVTVCAVASEAATAGFFNVNPGKASERVAMTLVRFPVMAEQNCTIVALDVKEKKQVETASTGGCTGGPDNKDVVSYWGISPSKVTKEDGTEWH